VAMVLCLDPLSFLMASTELPHGEWAGHSRYAVTKSTSQTASTKCQCSDRWQIRRERVVQGSARIIAAAAVPASTAVDWGFVISKAAAIRAYVSVLLCMLCRPFASAVLSSHPSCITRPGPRGPAVPYAYPRNSCCNTLLLHVVFSGGIQC